MNEVQQQFINKGLVVMQPGGRWFVMSKKNSIEFVEGCRKAGIQILGIDGFYLHEKGKIEPSMENSVDFTTPLSKANKNIYEEAITFLNARNDSLYFEIVCSK